MGEKATFLSLIHCIWGSPQSSSMEWTLPKARIFRQHGLLASAQLSPSSSQGLQIFSKTFLRSKFWCDGICLWNGEVGLHSPSGWDVVCTCQEGSARSQSCPWVCPSPFCSQVQRYPDKNLDVCKAWSKDLSSTSRLNYMKMFTSNYIYPRNLHRWLHNDFTRNWIV